jgi:hypothetical protein
MLGQTGLCGTLHPESAIAVTKTIDVAGVECMAIVRMAGGPTRSPTPPAFGASPDRDRLAARNVASEVTLVFAS